MEEAGLGMGAGRGQAAARRAWNPAAREQGPARRQHMKPREVKWYAHIAELVRALKPRHPAQAVDKC
jgi:hypothetical protein